MAHPKNRISLIVAGAACAGLSLSAGCHGGNAPPAPSTGSGNTPPAPSTGAGKTPTPPGTGAGKTPAPPGTGAGKTPTPPGTGAGKTPAPPGSAPTPPTTAAPAPTPPTTAAPAPTTAAPPPKAATNAGDDLHKIDHFVIIYLENHSFDNLYGEFAGAEGIDQAKAFAAAHPQIDESGVPYATLPPDRAKGARASFLPRDLPNAPFSLDPYIPLDWMASRAQASGPDLTHRFYHEIQQINQGTMDRFVALNRSGGLAMGYYHTGRLKLAAEATRYTLLDHFFHAAFGGSFLNHQWLVAAATPRWEGDPARIPSSMISVLNADGTVASDASLTPAPELAVVNTSYSVNAPHPPIEPKGPVPDASYLVPSFTNRTIGDCLMSHDIPWAWYAGGWDDALAGKPDPTFKAHHQPFVYYQSFADGTEAKAQHLLDETRFIEAAQAGTLPAVSFVKPLGVDDEHPSYTDVAAGEQHALDLINAVRSGPNWKTTAIIVTYDENGGFWDHVPPPVADQWGPGARVPTIVISPYAKKGFIDKTVYDTTAILALIEKRFGLAPLSHRDAAAADLAAGAFDFTQTP